MAGTIYQEVGVATRVFSIITKPDTGVELFEVIAAHLQALHDRGLGNIVSMDVMSSGRVILLNVRGASEEDMPTDEIIETVLDEAFVERLESLAQELMDGFYAPAFARCASEMEGDIRS